MKQTDLLDALAPGYFFVYSVAAVLVAKRSRLGFLWATLGGAFVGALMWVVQRRAPSPFAAWWSGPLIFVASASLAAYGASLGNGSRWMTHFFNACLGTLMLAYLVHSFTNGLENAGKVFSFPFN